MSQENVDLLRSLYAELAEGRLDTRLHLFSPEVEYARPSASAEAADLVGSWHGLQGMREAIREWLEAFDDVRFMAGRYLDLGESVLVLTRFTATAKASGIRFANEGADVVTVRDGQIVRLHSYLDRDEALEAVGLRE